MANHEPEVVVITGASAGVGRAVVREFAKHGARIGLIARDRDRLETVKREVEQAGGEALVLPTDVADADQVEAAARTVEDTWGRIDVWVNDAMAAIFAPVMEISPEEFRRVTEVTYLGFVWGTMAALKRMLPRDKGTIVQVGSALAYRSIPLQSAYCGAKHAIVGFTDSLRCELIHEKSNVHLTVVHLPAVNTPQFLWGRTKMPRQPQPVPPVFEPEVPARAIYYAAHHRRREIFVAGSVFKAIYGQMLVPGFADWYLGKTGYEAQQTPEPLPENRPDNLFNPVPGNFGARGKFTAKSKKSSPVTWLSLHRNAIAIAASAGAIAGTMMARAGRS